MNAGFPIDYEKFHQNLGEYVCPNCQFSSVDQQVFHDHIWMQGHGPFMHANSNGQPAPSGNGHSVTDAVVADLTLRRDHGTKKYGTELLTNNGRDALVDAYQEAVDLTVYLKQALMERDSQVSDELFVLRQIPSLIPDGVGLGTDGVTGARRWMYSYVAKQLRKHGDTQTADRFDAIAAIKHGS